MRIGVSGHTNITPATAGLVSRALRDLLAGQDDVTGVTCLARGADQVFAQVVLDVGGRVEVVLPARDYRAAKVGPDNAVVFDALLGRASVVRYAPFETSGDAAYMAASEMLVGSVERLVAVWDGRPAGGHGGTADVVAHARAAGLPVDVVWPDGAARG
ncbi:hypothetical protein BTM25_05470 [Actinomadura rubteroloni]|uniref:Uncharacterized protein n=1 Tax=Actinomadura rubteroloni TaxID=1926885 RepID=A0A2P4UM83_9ACTN|nr:hypothetical protein [Actinomadura rubteroloni]POM26158.1 hypothetical protein BTM25_05470 [Actinomadura rubteroloni]